jgi:predicted nucleotidyltransferase
MTAPSAAISAMTKLLIDAARPRRIILFGSQARGDASEDSDVDIMVVERDPPNRLAEMVRSNRIVRPLGIAVEYPANTRTSPHSQPEGPFRSSVGRQTLYEAE